ncbi:MAG: TolC family protein [Gammaproteobacteria bacterium]|nr:TolC family protein [Gammaproteobacteria bacterium]
MMRIVLLFTLAVAPAFGDEKVQPFARLSDATGISVLAQASPQGGATSGAAGAVPEGEALTLEQAISLALQKNRQVQNSTLDVAKSQDQIESSKTQRFPQLQLAVTPAYRVNPIDLTYQQGAFGTYPAPSVRSRPRRRP